MTKIESAGAKPSPKMIARIWQGRVREPQAEEYAAFIREHGLKRMAAIDGHLGAQIMLKADKGIAELTVISYWEAAKAEKAIREFSGDDKGRAFLLDKDREYLIDPATTVEHHSVLFSDWKRSRG